MAIAASLVVMTVISTSFGQNPSGATTGVGLGQPRRLRPGGVPARRKSVRLGETDWRRDGAVDPRTAAGGGPWLRAGRIRARRRRGDRAAGVRHPLGHLLDRRAHLSH